MNDKIERAKREFGKIYNDHIEKIYRFIYLKVNSKETAEDLASDTFLRVWKKYKGGKQEIRNVTNFLYQTARNLVIDYYRKKGKVRIVSVEETPLSDPKVDLEKKAIQNSDLEIIKKTLQELKEDYQNVILWHYVEGFSIKEIAQMMGKTEGGVRVLLSRALKTLKTKLS